MNITITGANGYIGTHLTPYLATKGHKINAVTRIESSSPDANNIVVDPGKLNSENFPPTDVLIHLAGIAHSKEKISNKTYAQVNTLLPLKIAQLAQKNNVRQFIFLSTSKVHGEESVIPIKSNAAYDPRDIYSETKVNAERMLKSLGSSSMHIVAIRPPVVYGPNPKANIASLLDACKSRKILPLPNIENRRSFLYVGNLCSAIESIILNPKTSFQGYVLDDGVATSTEALALSIAEAVSSKPRIIHLSNSALSFVDQVFEKTIGRQLLRPLYTNFEIDCSDFIRDYNWQPPYDLHTALKKSFGQTS